MNRKAFLKLMGSGVAGLGFGSEAFSHVLTEAERDRLARGVRIDPVHVGIRNERGGPRLYIDGVETSPFFGLSPSLLPTIENFRRMGIRLLQPVIGLRWGWLGPDQYDWTPVEDYLLQLVDKHPEALFFPRIQLNTPTWWKEEHPEEMIEYGTPYPDRLYDIVVKRPLTRNEGGHFYRSGRELWEASLASEVWLEDTSQMLRRFIGFVSESTMRERVIGYFMGHGRTGEWNYFGADYFPDYSTPMQKACGRVPSVRERMNASYGLLRDPVREEHVVDFYRCYHQAVTRNIVHLSAVIKETTDNTKLCGTFYGYLTESVRIQDGGYLDPMSVLNCPDLDLIACPYAYQNTNVEGKKRWESDMEDAHGNVLGRARGVGGDAAFRAMVRSVTDRGKLFIAELDTSTYLDATDSWRGIGGSASNTVDGTIRILRRDLGKVFANGVGGWLYDFGPLHGVDSGWYGSDTIIETVQPLVNHISRREGRDLSTVAQTAVFCDARSFLTTRHWLVEKPWHGYGIRFSDVFNHWFLNAQSRVVYRMGAPVDWLHREDFRAELLSRYKLLLFPNTFLLTEDEATAIRKALAGSGVTAVWYYASGFQSPSGFQQDQMERLTGFSFTVLDTPGPMDISVSSVAAGVEDGFGIKSPDHYYPRFAVHADDVEILGSWSDQTEYAAFARKSMDGWTSVYVGTAPLPAGWLRRLADDAGVDLYSSTSDIVEASEDAAMLVATSPGTRTISLHKPMLSLETGTRAQAHDIQAELGDVFLFEA